MPVILLETELSLPTTPPPRPHVAHITAMGPQGDCSLDLDPRDIVIQREVSRSEASTVLEVQICGETRVMKLVSQVSLLF